MALASEAEEAGVEIGASAVAGILALGLVFGCGVTTGAACSSGANRAWVGGWSPLNAVPIATGADAPFSGFPTSSPLGRGGVVIGRYVLNMAMAS